VIVGRMKAPAWDEEAENKLIEDPMVEKSEPARSLRGIYELMGYDGVGVTLRYLREGEPPFLVPWSAVLEIIGTEPRS
jgi:hypothetical protein